MYVATVTQVKFVGKRAYVCFDLYNIPSVKCLKKARSLQSPSWLVDGEYHIPKKKLAASSVDAL
ncbi:MAG: hypothetical protein Devi2KO_40620 [Devosia indica]